MHIPGTEIRIVDPSTRQPLAVGQRGLVLVRGPQIMQGYYQNPEMTAKAIDSQAIAWSLDRPQFRSLATVGSCPEPAAAST